MRWYFIFLSPVLFVTPVLAKDTSDANAELPSTKGAVVLPTATPVATMPPRPQPNPTDEGCSTCVPAKAGQKDSGGTKKNETTSKDEKSKDQSGMNRDQSGCLSICKKYDELCRNDDIYDKKDCDDQWGACQDACMTL